MVPGSRLYWDMLLIGIVLQITGYQGAVIAPISGLSCFPSEMSAQRAREGERERGRVRTRYLPRDKTPSSIGLWTTSSSDLVLRRPSFIGHHPTAIHMTKQQHLKNRNSKPNRNGYTITLHLIVNLVIVKSIVDRGSWVMQGKESERERDLDHLLAAFH